MAPDIPPGMAAQRVRGAALVVGLPRGQYRPPPPPPRHSGCRPPPPREDLASARGRRRWRPSPTSSSTGPSSAGAETCGTCTGQAGPLPPPLLCLPSFCPTGVCHAAPPPPFHGLECVESHHEIGDARWRLAGKSSLGGNQQAQPGVVSGCGRMNRSVPAHECPV